MVYFRKILEAALSLCLMVDGRILKVVDQIGLLLGLRRFPLNKGSGKSSLFKRWVIYSLMSALTVGVGVISCADAKSDTDIGGPVVQPTPKKSGKVLGFEVEPLDAQVKATWNDPVLEEGAEVSEYKISVYKMEGFKIAHLKTEMYPYQEGRREAIVSDLMNGQIYTFQIEASNAQARRFRQPGESFIECWRCGRNFDMEQDRACEPIQCAHTLKAFDGSGASDSVSQDVRVGPTPPLEKLTGSTGGANSSKTWILHRSGFALGTWPGGYTPRSCKYHRRKRIFLVAWSIDGKFYTPTRETLHPRR